MTIRSVSVVGKSPLDTCMDVCLGLQPASDIAYVVGSALVHHACCGDADSIIPAFLGGMYYRLILQLAAVPCVLHGIDPWAYDSKFLFARQEWQCKGKNSFGKDVLRNVDGTDCRCARSQETSL